MFITDPVTDGTVVGGTVWFTIWLENAAAGTRNLTLTSNGPGLDSVDDQRGGQRQSLGDDQRARLGGHGGQAVRVANVAN